MSYDIYLTDPLTGNAGKALWDLRELCQLAPWAVIQGD